MRLTAENTAPPGFSAVDSTADPAALVAALDEQAALPAVQRLRARAIELLNPRRGQRLLDAGCGTGDVTRALAALVGKHGRVVGVDPSATMLTEARRRTGGSHRSVEFCLGDITALEVEDRAFDGAYCERVFQHLTHPGTAMAELVRVTKPGGSIVVIEADWGMYAIQGSDPDLTARVTGCWAHAVPNGLVRQAARQRLHQGRNPRADHPGRDTDHHRPATTNHRTDHDHARTRGGAIPETCG
jgi:ubiquinone/menaquinone biosynthesis C-methylase UbiE